MRLGDIAEYAEYTSSECRDEEPRCPKYGDLLCYGYAVSREIFVAATTPRHFIRFLRFGRIGLTILNRHIFHTSRWVITAGAHPRLRPPWHTPAKAAGQLRTGVLTAQPSRVRPMSSELRGAHCSELAIYVV